MHARHLAFLCLVLAVLLAATAFLAGAAAGGRAAPSPPLIGMVSVDKVIDGLTERADHNGVLKARLDELQANVTKMENDFKDGASKLEVLKDGPEKTSALNSLRRLRFQLEAEKESSQRELNALEGDLLCEMCKRVEAACTTIAQRDGYTIVISNDSGVDVCGDTAAQVNTKMSIKRVMFASTVHDITAEVITLMNNEYAASKPSR